jgi:predicted DNA repair protein MutK
VDRSHIITTATGAVALAVAAPVVISMASLISFAWPVIPLLTVGSIWLAFNKQDKDRSYEHNNNNNKNSKETKH